MPLPSPNLLPAPWLLPGVIGGAVDTVPPDPTADLLAIAANPVVSGSAVVGGTLGATTGTWTGPPATFTYQWRRDTGTGPVVVSGATAPSYVLTEADRGALIDAVVTATTADGQTGTVVTTAVQVATLDAPPPPPPPTDVPPIDPGLPVARSARRVRIGESDGARRGQAEAIKAAVRALTVGPQGPGTGDVFLTERVGNSPYRFAVGTRVEQTPDQAAVVREIARRVPAGRQWTYTAITGGTWADLLATHATWQAVLDAFPTWQDVLADPSRV